MAYHIAVVSGKGGSGKTLVAVNLAYLLQKDYTVHLYDLDVEEPNAHLFFPSEDKESVGVPRMVPKIDEGLCDYCGVCSEVCVFNAIITLANQVLVFPELCHSCYACLEMCPQKAISASFKTIGQIMHWSHDGLPLTEGRLKIGESATPALIRETKRKEQVGADIVIYDAPPGTSCPVIEAVQDMDLVLLVGESTPFGLNDMHLMVTVLQQLKVPFAVIANKVMPNDKSIPEYCAKHDIALFTELPHRLDIARVAAQSLLVVKQLPELRKQFLTLIDQLQQTMEWAPL